MGRVRACREALKVIDQRSDATEWGVWQTELGNALLDSPDLPAALEEALGAYQEALTVFTRDRSPRHWAALHLNNAAAYESLADYRGDAADHVIEACDSALQVLTPSEDPAAWALAHSRLGGAYTSRTHGDVTANLHRAIEHYQYTLRVYSPEADRDSWVASNLALAQLAWWKTDGNRGANIEEALSHFEAVASVLDEGATADSLARVHIALGKAFCERHVGERAANVEKGIHHFGLAASVCSPDDNPVLWAMLHIGLGDAYQERVYGHRSVNLEEALQYYKVAVTTGQHILDPVARADLYHNMGLAFRDRVTDDKVANLKAAKDCFEGALALRPRESNPRAWAATENALGGLYLELERSGAATADDLARALEHFTDALTVHTRENFPWQWAGIHSNIAVCYRMQSKEIESENYRAALVHYALALEIFTPEDFPAEAAETEGAVADTHFDQKAWSDASACYASALSILEQTFTDAYTLPGREAASAIMSELSSRRAYCLLRLGGRDAALVELERGKARILTQRLALDHEVATLGGDDAEAARSSLQAIRLVEHASWFRPPGIGPEHDVEATEILHSHHEQLRHSLARARAENEGSPATELDVAGIGRAAPPGGALVAPVMTSQGTAVVICLHRSIHIEEEHVLWLDTFTLDRLSEILAGTSDRHGWLAAYEQWNGDDRDLESWKAAVDDVLHDLHEALMGPLAERLNLLGVARGALVAFAPQGHLGLLPLHAASHAADSGGPCFLDRFAVSYVPSAYALSVSRRRADARASADSLLAIVNPTDDLPFAPLEAEYVGRAFGHASCDMLIGSKATVAAVEQAIGGRTHVHFACHGFYDWEDPLSSGLRLADGAHLFLATVLAFLDLSAAPLVTLSACETALSDILKAPEEYVGLPAGFVRAGASGVVSAIWAVYDLAAAVLIDRFYGLHVGDGLPPAEALRRAQLWMRDATATDMQLAEWFERQLKMDPAHRDAALVGAEYFRENPDEKCFSHPVFWAPFTYVGA